MLFFRYILFAVKEAEQYSLPIGKTMIQKIIYFMLDDAEKRVYYKPYFFGMYSPTVQWSIERLTEEIPGIGKKYLRESSQDGRDRFILDDHLKKKQWSPDRYSEKVSRILHFFHEHRYMTAEKMAILSKIHLFYFHRYRKNLQLRAEDIAYIKERSKILGWKNIERLTDEELHGYFTDLKTLDCTLST